MSNVQSISEKGVVLVVCEILYFRIFKLFPSHGPWYANDQMISPSKRTSRTNLVFPFGLTVSTKNTGMVETCPIHKQSENFETCPYWLKLFFRFYWQSFQKCKQSSEIEQSCRWMLVWIKRILYPINFVCTGYDAPIQDSW